MHPDIAHVVVSGNQGSSLHIAFDILGFEHRVVPADPGAGKSLVAHQIVGLFGQDEVDIGFFMTGEIFAESLFRHPGNMRFGQTIVIDDIHAAVIADGADCRDDDRFGSAFFYLPEKFPDGNIAVQVPLLRPVPFITAVVIRVVSAPDRAVEWG